jgi:hypothetical protein
MTREFFTPERRSPRLFQQTQDHNIQISECGLRNKQLIQPPLQHHFFEFFGSNSPAATGKLPNDDETSAVWPLSIGYTLKPGCVANALLRILLAIWRPRRANWANRRGLLLPSSSLEFLGNLWVAEAILAEIKEVQPQPVLHFALAQIVQVRLPVPVLR